MPRKNESPTSPQYCTLPRKSESLTSCSTAPFYAKFPECTTPCFSMFTLRCFSCIGSFSTKFRLMIMLIRAVFLPFHAIFTYLVLFKGSRGGAPCLISFYKFCWQTIIHSDPRTLPTRSIKLIAATKPLKFSPDGPRQSIRPSGAITKALRSSRRETFPCSFKHFQATIPTKIAAKLSQMLFSHESKMFAMIEFVYLVSN